jgi:hypothetical protein
MTSQREKAIQLALEKQNELINEQNAWLEKLLNQTYSLHLSFLSEDGGNHLIKPNL